MPTWTIRVDMPPKGKLEEGDGTGELTDEATEEESRYRQEFLDFVAPRAATLLARPLHRSSNVECIEVHGANTWSNMNHYQVLVSVDIGGLGFEREELLPPEAEVTVIGDYVLLEKWPPDPDA